MGVQKVLDVLTFQISLGGRLDDCFDPVLGDRADIEEIDEFQDLLDPSFYAERRCDRARRRIWGHKEAETDDGEQYVDWVHGASFSEG